MVSALLLWLLPSVSSWINSRISFLALFARFPCNKTQHVLIWFYNLYLAVNNLLSSVFQLNQAGRKADYSYPLSSAISYFAFAMFLFFYYNVRSFYAQVKNSFILLLYSYFLYMQLILCKHCVFLSKSQHRPFTINCITIRTKSCCHSHPNGWFIRINKNENKKGSSVSCDDLCLSDQ